MLFADTSLNSRKVFSNWERELQLKLSEDQCEQIFTMAHRGSLNVLIQENNYKTLIDGIVLQYYSTNMIQTYLIDAGDVPGNLALYYISGGHVHYYNNSGHKSIN